MNNPWECPRCHRINAPWMPCCSCKPKELSYAEQQTNAFEEIMKNPDAYQQRPSDHIADARRYLIPMRSEHGWLGICPVCNIRMDSMSAHYCT